MERERPFRWRQKSHINFEVSDQLGDFYMVNHLSVSGIELSVSFVAKDEAASVSVELNGVKIDDIIIPAKPSPQCQLDNSWNRKLTPSSDQQEITFTFKGSPPSAGRKRAPASLELGQIRYICSTT